MYHQDDGEMDAGMSDTDDTPERSLDSRMHALKDRLMTDYPMLRDKLCLSACKVSIGVEGCPTIRSSRRSWQLVYPVISFMMNGQLFAECARVTGMLGLYFRVELLAVIVLLTGRTSTNVEEELEEYS